ncbi:hypothetical protein OKA04_05115 [Luteolibacter flavescens]|uniref:EF-hand domain-containing protein n=1 Tax=Luteolibacter flavescens TaxID=1859460 RepID=A0ABT3FL84_9BACT|nr:EF-hand domain-containing protein [Luteolibacter flavescens]MCW1884099.1 hypothetical protein [Luteolibacter flavescens]
MRFAFLPFLCAFIAAPAVQAQSAPKPNRATKAHIRAFERLDLDNDESLSPAELLKATASVKGSFTATNAVVHAWFDLDENGGIDLGEWLDGRTGNGNSEEPSLSGDAAVELDKNGNEKVSRTEFSRVINRYVPAKITRTWFAAQFPGGQVTGSTSVWNNIWDWNFTVVGWDTVAPVGPVAGD